MNFIVTKFSKGKSFIYKAIHKKTKEELYFFPNTLETFFNIWYGSVQNIIGLHSGDAAMRRSNSKSKEVEINNYIFSVLNIKSFNEEKLRELLTLEGLKNKELLKNPLFLSKVLEKCLKTNYQPTLHCCKYCDFQTEVEFVLNKYHNNNCPTLTQILSLKEKTDIKCDFCKFTSKNQGTVNYYHNDNCKFNPKNFIDGKPKVSLHLSKFS